MKFQGIINARDLGGISVGGKTIRPGRLLRTAHLSDATDDDIRILSEEYRLKRIFDFRSVVEAEGQPDLGLMKIDFDQTYWTHGSDGYYYYKTALQPGAVTEPLFASVSFDISMDNKYQNSTAKVDVTVYAVQTANNGSSAFEAKGWPEE